MPVVDVKKDLDAFSLTIVADFAAPVERVWQIYADPRQLERVWGPAREKAAVDRTRPKNKNMRIDKLPTKNQIFRLMAKPSGMVKDELRLCYNMIIIILFI